MRPSREAIRRVLQMMADDLNAEDPDHHYTVHEPGEPSPAGAVTVRVSDNRRRDEE